MLRFNYAQFWAEPNRSQLFRSKSFSLKFHRFDDKTLADVNSVALGDGSPPRPEPKAR